jgi:exopolysaccharide biosynthesis polyprenyl glycosylphosphotransferase
MDINRDVAPLGSTWQKRYARRLLVIDILALTWVVFGVQLAWLGLSAREVAFSGTAFNVVGSYFTISALIIVGWVTVLTIFGSRQAKVVGGGSQEYRLVATATIWLFGLVAIVAYLLQIQLARGYILIAFPVGLFTLLFVRWLSRQWLRQERARGLYSSKVLLVGSIPSTTTVAQALLKNTDFGYVVMGACVSGVPAVGESGKTPCLPGTNIPILGGIPDAQSAMEAVGADTLIVTSADLLTPEEVRRLSWNLEPLRHNLIVAPSLMDVGGPRIHVRPVAGLPLLHIDSPVFEGRQKFAKRFFDIAVSSVLLVLLTPLMLVVALIVRFSSRGPVFYRQERIGLNQKPFHVWKFRTMVVDADDQLADLLRSQEQGDVPFFKVQADPRIMPAGRFLRRYSLDELPQIFNVLLGDMSLVGPRPQRDMEVALYDDSARRRLLVQPGMTGLWQVSGRSNLTWEESIRLDLYYVENWSVMGDIILMWRTLRTVILHTGAM